MTQSPSALEIYTDGSQHSINGLGNFGGWAAVILSPSAPQTPDIRKGSVLVAHDSGSMEMLAVINALEGITTPNIIALHTDHKDLAALINRYSYAKPDEKQLLRTEYCLNSANKQITQERELFPKLFDLLDKHPVGAKWVPSHSGIKWNELANTEACNCRKAARKTLEKRQKDALQGRPLYNAELPDVEIHTYGSKKGKNGNWGAVVIYKAKPEEHNVYSGEPYFPKDSGSTEVSAVTGALKTLKSPHNVTIYTDRRDLKTMINEYSRAESIAQERLRKAHRENMRDCRVTQDRGAVQEMFIELSKHHVHAIWERSHSNNPHNISADIAASAGVRRNDEELPRSKQRNGHPPDAPQKGWAHSVRDKPSDRERQ